MVVYYSFFSYRSWQQMSAAQNHHSEPSIFYCNYLFQGNQLQKRLHNYVVETGMPLRRWWLRTNLSVPLK